MLGAIQWNQAVWDGPRVRRVGLQEYTEVKAVTMSL
jgi:hypothetical protein